MLKWYSVDLLQFYVGFWRGLVYGNALLVRNTGYERSTVGEAESSSGGKKFLSGRERQIQGEISFSKNRILRDVMLKLTATKTNKQETV